MKKFYLLPLLALGLVSTTFAGSACGSSCDKPKDASCQCGDACKGKCGDKCACATDKSETPKADTKK